MAGLVIVPWYATGFRANGFAEDLQEVAAIALRYGATSYAVYRSQSDKYRFQQLAELREAPRLGSLLGRPEMIYFRTAHSSWYQVPVLYDWWDLETSGAIDDDAALWRATATATVTPSGSPAVTGRRRPAARRRQARSACRRGARTGP